VLLRIDVNKYKVDNLSSKTSKPEQTKLIHALEGVAGVKTATLHLHTHEFTVEPLEQKTPIKREEITAAASKAGFTVTKS